MNITLNSSEAQTLYNTGRLIRTVDCDWQPPRQAIEIRDDTVYVMLSTGPVWSKKLTPPLEVGAVYDVYVDEEVSAWEGRRTLIEPKATPTYKLIIEEGKLRWYEELKRV